MPDKLIAVRRPFNPIVEVPERLRDTDVIEIRVTMTPLRWHEADKRYDKAPESESAGAMIQIARVEARDSRAVFSILKQLLRMLVREYFDLKDVF